MEAHRIRPDEFLEHQLFINLAAYYSVEKRKISEIMDRLLVSVSAGTKRTAAIRLMEGSNLDALPVLEDGRLVGIVRMEALRSSSSDSINAAMQKPLFVEMESSIDHGIKYMLARSLSRVPVVDSAIGMRCIGTVSASRLLSAKKSEKK